MSETWCCTLLSAVASVTSVRVLTTCATATLRVVLAGATTRTAFGNLKATTWPKAPSVCDAAYRRLVINATRCSPDAFSSQLKNPVKTQKRGYFEAYGMILVLTELLVVCKTNGRV